MYSEIEFRLITKRNVLIFVAAMAFSSGFTLRIPALILLAELLTVLLLISWWFSRRLLDTLQIERQHTRHAFEESEVEVSLFCRHEAPHPLHLLELIEQFAPAESTYVYNLVDIPFGRDRQLNLHYTGRCSHRRGLYLIGPIRASVADPLGIFMRRRTVEAVTPLYVLPKSRAIEGMDLLSQGTIRHIGHETLPVAGRSEAFLHLREYARGDNPRHIHWPSTARYDQLIVKEFEDNVMTDVNMILDLRRIAQRGVGDVTSTELIIKAAACIAQTAIEKSHRVQIFSVSEGVEHIPAGEGEAHLFHILDRMTVWRPQGNTNFGQTTREQLCFVRKGSTLVWIVSASVFHPEWIEPSIPLLLRDDVKVMIVFVDDRKFYKLYGEHEVYHEHGEKLEELIPRFKNLGCTVYAVDGKSELAAQLSLPVQAGSGGTE